eukprot:11087098-Ditylum_brightwellii.AAC.1
MRECNKCTSTASGPLALPCCDYHIVYVWYDVDCNKQEDVIVPIEYQVYNNMADQEGYIALLISLLEKSVVELLDRSSLVCLFSAQVIDAVDLVKDDSTNGTRWMCQVW